MHRIGGPVDVEGGWFDAGDYLKFTFTAAYADGLLYAAARALGSRAPASLLSEARYGTRWLNEMWHPRTRTLYLQVGIGSGNETTFFGDHDLCHGGNWYFRGIMMSGQRMSILGDWELYCGWRMTASLPILRSWCCWKVSVPGHFNLWHW